MTRPIKVIGVHADSPLIRVLGVAIMVSAQALARLIGARCLEAAAGMNRGSQDGESL